MIILKKTSWLNRADEKRFIKNCYRYLESNSSPLKEKAVPKKSRADLLAERKSRLVKIASSAAPDALIVYACQVYLQTYFGNEWQMIYGLIKSRILWQIENAQIRTEILIERIYYRYFCGYTEKQWQTKLNTELEDFLKETNW